MNIRKALAAVAILGLLLIAAPAAAAAADHGWKGNGYPSASCNPETTGVAQWVWTGDNPTALTVNGQAQSGTWAQSGGGSWKFFMTIGATNWPPTTASVSYTGDDGVLTISGCNEGSTPSSPPSSEPSSPPSSEPSSPPSSEPSSPPESAPPSEAPSSEPSSEPSSPPESAPPSEAPSTEPSSAPSASASFGGGVGGETDTPTAPPTDQNGITSGSTPTLPLLLIILGVVGLGAVVLTPRRARR